MGHMLYYVYNMSDAKLVTIKTISIILTSDTINKSKLGLEKKITNIATLERIIRKGSSEGRISGHTDDI